MFQLKESSLEWALKHVTRFSANDFFPKPFEFKAIADQWDGVKKHLSKLDLHDYAPQTPVVALGLKPNGTFRVVHQLDPLDSIIYTALTYEIAAKLEQYRIPREKGIVWSYRIKPSVKGSFFDPEDNTWREYNRKTKKLAAEFSDGYVATCDLVDFYNQIYTHRIQNLIEEACGLAYEAHGKAMEKFLLGLNTLTSRGIPVGPAPSIIIAELIAADIDKKILTYTNKFVRWVDDISIFFDTRDEAEKVLHELTAFVHSNHRLVFSGEKTRILTVERFVHKMRDEEEEEKRLVEARAKEKAMKAYWEELIEEIPLYDAAEAFDEDRFQEVLEAIQKDGRYDILSEVYLDLLRNELKKAYPSFPLIRRILRNAGRYRIRSIVPVLFKYFEKIVPLLREVVLYLLKVLTKDIAKSYKDEFQKIIDSPRTQLPFVNTWIAALLQHPAFNAIEVPENYDNIFTLRDRALIATRREDRTWVKGYKNGVDTLGPWDKRAVLYSAQILSKDEKKTWLRIAGRRGDCLEAAVAKFAAR
jgi:Reverse transcriptase (RNA-dependent DNA polymerase)